MKPTPIHAALAIALLALGGCAEDLSKRLEGRESLVESAVVNQDNGDGTITTQIDAANRETWVYFDFETRGEVRPQTPADSADWDLAFQRFHIQLNGGESGSGDVMVAMVEGSDLGAVTSAPDVEYLTDQADGDADGLPEYVMSTGDSRWYDYDAETHLLTPKEIIYVIRSVEGQYYKLNMLQYYNDAGSAGHPQFYWAPLQ